MSFIVASLFCYSCNNSSTDSAATKAITDSLAKAVADSVSAPAQVAKSLDDIGFELLKTERFGNINIGLTATQTTEALGVPEKKGKQEEWEADGESHQSWDYKNKGIVLDMMGKEEQVISSITISAPCTLKTSKNIGIGSTEAEVKAAYDFAIDKANTEAGQIVAGTVYGGVIFGIENGTVTSIFAGAAAE